MSATKYLGQPCRRCGGADRYVKSNKCVECRRIANAKARGVNLYDEPPVRNKPAKRRYDGKDAQWLKLLKGYKMAPNKGFSCANIN